MRSSCVFVVAILFSGTACLFAQEPSAVLPSPQSPSSEKASPESATPNIGPANSVIIRGRLIQKDPAVEYPQDAYNARIQGVVRLRVVIAKDGTIKDIRVIRGHPILADAAMKAIRQWRYEPSTLNGEPQEVEIRVRAIFAEDGRVTVDEVVPMAETLANRLGTTSQENAGPPLPPGVFRIGNGVTIPRAIYQPDPEYSEKARKKKLNGVVILSLIVTPEGTAQDVKVTKGLGMGLDEKAIEAVSKWKFDPGTKDGKPVAVQIMVEVDFRLY